MTEHFPITHNEKSQAWHIIGRGEIYKYKIKKQGVDGWDFKLTKFAIFSLAFLNRNGWVIAFNLLSVTLDMCSAAATKNKCRRQVQSMDSFWKRWSREHCIHSKAGQNLKVGDMVLLAQNLIPRVDWPLAIVREVKTGRDGLVRSVRLWTGHQKSFCWNLRENNPIARWSTLIYTYLVFFYYYLFSSFF